MSLPESTAISVRGLGKAYAIGAGPRESTFVEACVRKAKEALRGQGTERFWALRDLSFDVDRGEVVGVIGRNGAGKSTLLKILSRITEPTEGEAILRGRTGSLLEVGTGFHRELTGRENIYLNGCILGMSRREIDARFDEIVQFSGVEKFLDTPVKRYSSGMFVRLAFAVAAHLRTEILIVDEVLAVGDAQFQKKCLGKMEDVARSGRTVLFVSHNMGTMQALCKRAMLLRDGGLVVDGPTERVVDQYLDDLTSEGGLGTDADERAGTGEARVTDVRLIDEDGLPATSIVGGGDLELQIDYTNNAGVRHPKIIANIYNHRGVAITSIGTELTNPDLPPLAEQGTLSCRLRRLPLMPGRYRIAIALHADGRSADYLPAALVFEVASSLFYPSGRVPAHATDGFMIEHEWQHEPLAPAAVAEVRAKAERA